MVLDKPKLRDFQRFWAIGLQKAGLSGVTHPHLLPAEG
jgi:hypothetical protein